MAKRGRKKVVISKRSYIDEYWAKNEKKLTPIFSGYGTYSAEYAFKRKAELQIANDIRFNSKKTAKKALDDFVYATSHTAEETKLRTAKENAFENQGASKVFDKITKLNKRIDPIDYIDCDIPLADAINPITNSIVHRKVVGYWNIKNSNYVLAQFEGKIDDDSFFNYYEFVDRSDLGV